MSNNPRIKLMCRVELENERLIYRTLVCYSRRKVSELEYHTIIQIILGENHSMYLDPWCDDRYIDSTVDSRQGTLKK